MRYDIRLVIRYEYPGAASSGRHLLRMVPQTLAGEQKVTTSLLSVDPKPSEWHNRTDFFGNSMVEVAFDHPVEETSFRLDARVERFGPARMLDMSPTPGDLGREISAHHSLGPDAPHHFVNSSPRAPVHPSMTGFARHATSGARSVWEAVERLGLALHGEMRFDPDATTVDTPALEAFEERHGVCQDFSHIMIACLRGIGIPAGYVSGFLRTLPPPGRERLEGADAMHAWVRAWCGHEVGWREYDPTNAMIAGPDHVVIARGRDYSDVAPITGAMRSSGGQFTAQAVDVIPLDD